MAHPAVAADSPGAPALGKRPGRGRELLLSYIPSNTKRRKKNERKKIIVLICDLSLIKVIQMGHVPQLIAIDFRGFGVGLLKAPPAQFNLSMLFTINLVPTS